MHHYLKLALHDIVTRCELNAPRTAEHAEQARVTARAARRLLLHDSPAFLVERWIDAHPVPPLQEMD